MTWTQFKALIDAQLKEKGISEDVELLHIDVTFVEGSPPPTVYDTGEGVYIEEWGGERWTAKA